MNESSMDNIIIKDSVRWCSFKRKPNYPGWYLVVQDGMLSTENTDDPILDEPTRYQEWMYWSYGSWWDSNPDVRYVAWCGPFGPSVSYDEWMDER